MIGKISNLFPLSIYQVNGGLSKQVRDNLVKEIDNSIEVSGSEAEGTWTGDVEGYHNIHKTEVYRPVFTLFAKAVREYTKAMGVKDNEYDTYYTRSWGVRQRSNKIIEPHTHAVSHLTGVYYPKVPEGSGNLVVHPKEHQNELFGGLYNVDSYGDGSIDLGNPLCSDNHGIKVTEDLLVLFPSKTPHKTSPNVSDKSRYSISTDILFVLKDAHKKEHGIPPIEEWRKTTEYG